MDVLTTDELMAWLGISRRTIYYKRIPALMPGRYLVSEVLQYLKDQRRGKPTSPP